MPRFQFQLDNAQINSICDQRDYQATIPDTSPNAIPGATIPNPQTKVQFVELVIRQFLFAEACAGKMRSRAAARIVENTADAALMVVSPGAIS